MAASVLAALLAGLVPQPATAQPMVHGADASVVVERTSGRIAVLRTGKVEIFDDPALISPASSFSVPVATARLVDFRGDLLVLSFTIAGEERWAALSSSGEEWLIWPNQGIGEHFPSGDARLTLDGSGLYQFLLLDEGVREELEVPLATPNGSGVIASFRFADERVAARFSSAFADALSLSPGDFVAAMHEGGALRYAASAGVVWKLDRPKSGRWRLHDADLRTDSVVAEDATGELRLVSLTSGEQRGRWLPPDDLGTVLGVRVLRDGRALVLAKEEERRRLALVGLEAARLVVRNLFAPASEGPGDLAGFWSQQALDLRSVMEIGPGLLLVRGPEGWYELRLP